MRRVTTVAELRDEIDDAIAKGDEGRLEDLGAMFEDGGPRDHLFRANPRIRPELAVVGAESARPETLLDFANRIANKRRRLRYERMIASGHSDPGIVAEGDSWFQYPLMLQDTIDVIMNTLPVFCMSAAGALLDEIMRSGELVRAVRDRRPRFVLLSAGGNDLLDEGEFPKSVEEYTPGATAAQLINEEAFDNSLRRVEAMMVKLLTDVFGAHSGTRVLVHGYDYVLPRAIRGNYLGRRLREKGIPLRTQREVMRLIIGRYNDWLAALPRKFGGRSLTYVSCLDLVGKRPRADWFDEIHPRDPGFVKVANKFLEAMR